MPQCDLTGVVIAHADRGQGIERGELLLPELRLIARRAAVRAVEIDIGQARRGTGAGTVRCPLIGVDGLGRALSGIVDSGHERKDMLEIWDRGDRSVRIAAIDIYQVRELAAGCEVISAARWIDV